jgi:hypothetical protein
MASAGLAPKQKETKDTAIPTTWDGMLKMFGRNGHPTGRDEVVPWSTVRQQNTTNWRAEDSKEVKDWAISLQRVVETMNVHGDLTEKCAGYQRLHDTMHIAGVKRPWASSVRCNIAWICRNTAIKMLG